MRKTDVIGIAIAFIIPFSANSADDVLKLAKPRSEYKSAKIFERVTGVPMPVHALTFELLNHWEDLINQGKSYEAAYEMTAQIGFDEVSVRNFASRISNLDNSPQVALDDLQYYISQIIVQGKDAREMLTGAYSAEVFNRSQTLKGVGQLAPNPNQKIPGIFGTAAFGERFFSAGTNRRPIKYMFEQFLCTPMAKVKNIEISDGFVRRDINRQPGNNPLTYQTTCRGCHAPMDAMARGISKYEFNGRQIVKSTSVAAKINANIQYPDVGELTDAKWENLLHKEAMYGFRGPEKGTGLPSLAKAFADSDAFDTCMIQKTFRETCGHEKISAEDMTSLRTRFSADQRNMRSLFARTSVASSCDTQKPQARNFRQYAGSLAILLSNSNPEPMRFLDYNVFPPPALASLPSEGTMEEYNSASTVAGTAKIGIQMCRKAFYSGEASTDPVNYYSKVLLGRLPTDTEKTELDILFKKSGSSIAVCAAIATGSELRLKNIVLKK